MIDTGTSPARGSTRRLNGTPGIKWGFDSVINKILTSAEKGLFVVSRISLFAMMLLITMDTAGRYFFNNPLHGTLEITELYLMGAVVFLSMSNTMRLGGHIRIRLLSDRFSPLLKTCLEILFGILSFCLFAAITYRSSGVAFKALAGREVVFGIIQWPVYISWLIVALGMGILTARILLNTVSEVAVVLGMFASGREKKSGAQG